MTMCATLVEVQGDSLLVCDRATGQEVVVHTPCTCRFRAGDLLRIQYNGAMTMSIPPQISADCIVRLSSRGC